MVVNAARKRCRDLPERAGERAEPVDERGNGFGDPVRPAVAALPEPQRLALFLRYYADLDYAAIAATLGIREGTVGATLNAALAALRETLKEGERAAVEGRHRTDGARGAGARRLGRRPA